MMGARLAEGACCRLVVLLPVLVPLLAAALVLGGMGAAAQSTTPPTPTPSAPLFNLGPLRWYHCLLKIFEVGKVDAVQQQFHMDAAFTCYYQEPFLFGLVPPGSLYPVPTSLQDMLTNATVMFNPIYDNKRDVVVDRELMFMSVLRPPAISTATLAMPDIPGIPWIIYTVRFAGTFKAGLELRNFPYDRQTLYINISSNAPDYAGFFVGQDWKADFNPFDGTDPIVGWQTLGHDFSNYSLFQPEFGVSLPRFSFRFGLEREPDYYINKIVWGVVLITIMSQATFMIEPHDTNRPMAAMTAFMGIVTFLFVIATDVPKVTYLTRMDVFVNLSFYFCFIDCLLHIVIYVLWMWADSAEKAERDAIKARRKKNDDLCWDRELREQRGGGGGFGDTVNPIVCQPEDRILEDDPYFSGVPTAQRRPLDRSGGSAALEDAACSPDASPVGESLRLSRPAEAEYKPPGCFAKHHRGIKLWIRRCDVGLMVALLIGYTIGTIAVLKI